jgi:hypothetical protein
VIAWIGENVSEERAASLGMRLRNENELAAKALERPTFGWAGWGRSRVYDIYGRDISVSDGGWIIALGEHGLFGLAAWCIAMLLPSARFLRDIPPRFWSHPRIAPLAAMAIIATLNAANNMLNVDVDPTYLVGMGGMVSVITALTVPQAVPSAARAPAPELQPAAV